MSTKLYDLDRPFPAASELAHSEGQQASDRKPREDDVRGCVLLQLLTMLPHFVAVRVAHRCVRGVGVWVCVRVSE